MRLRLPVLVLASSLAGCATIFNGSDYLVAVNSIPEGASVTVTNEKGVQVHRAETPFSTILNVGDGYFGRMEYSLRFEAVCHEPVETILTPSLDQWYWGNIIFGGPIGLLFFDPASGAMWRLDDHVSVALNPDEQACPAGAEEAESP